MNGFAKWLPDGKYQVPLAERAGPRNAAVGCGAGGSVRRAGLETGRGARGAVAAGMIAARSSGSRSNLFVYCAMPTNVVTLLAASE
jgi:hypothetical protein